MLPNEVEKTFFFLHLIQLSWLSGESSGACRFRDAGLGMLLFAVLMPAACRLYHTASC